MNALARSIKSSRRPVLLVLALGLVLVSVTAAQSQEPLTAPEPAPGAPGVAGTSASTPAPLPPPPTSDALTPDFFQAKIKEIESTVELPESVKTKALELYRTALAALESARAANQNAATFKASVESAPAQTQVLQAQINAPSQPSELKFPSDFTAKDVQPQLTKEQAQLTALKSQLAVAEQAIKSQQDRPQQIQRLITEARQQLEAREKDLQAPPPSDASPLVQDALVASLKARRSARAAEIEMLQQELVSNPARLELLKAQRQLLAKNIATSEANVASIQKTFNTLQQREAETAHLEAERLRLLAVGKHPLLQAITQQNADLSKELSEFTQYAQEAVKEGQELAKYREPIKEDFETVKGKIEKFGLTDVLGPLLRQKRKELPSPARYQKSAAKRQELITQINLRLDHLDDERKALLDASRPESIDHALRDVAPKDRPDIEAQFLRYAEDQQQLLGDLSDACGRYLTELDNLDFEERQLRDLVTRFAAFLDEHLLWVPSDPPISFGTFRDLKDALLWSLNPSRWGSTVRVLANEARAAPAPTGVAILLIIFMAVLRPRLRKLLDAYAQRVGKVYVDSYWLTLAAIGATLVLAAPAATVLGTLAWLARRAIDAPPFTKAIGSALFSSAGLLFLLEFFRHFFRADTGVAQAHLRWRKQTTSLLRRHLFWITLIVVPAGFLVNLTEAHPEEAFSQSLGRLAFVTAAIALAGFLARVLLPTEGLVLQILQKESDSWFARLRHLWYLAAIATPLVLAGLALAGYFYTALALAHRVAASALTVALVIVLHELAVRWLTLSHLRIALARAKQKKQAQQQSADDSPSSQPTPTQDVKIDIPEIDLATINAQTRQLLRVAAWVCLALFLWLIWDDVVPALNMFEHVVLWQRFVTTDAGLSLAPITLIDLALAFLFVVLTVTAARNLPGTLEVLVLQHLPLQPGTGYAISTISRYVITAVGLILAANALGFDWSQVQWLVAALGVGLGFGLQEIFANFVSGLIILFERPFRVGDTVTVGDVSGTVARIHIRATTITDWDRKELIVPNKSFITDRVINWTLSDPVTRLIVKVGIAYGSDTELAQRLMLDIVQSNPGVLAEPHPVVLFTGFGESSLDFEVRVFVNEKTNRGRALIIHDLHLAIDKAFRQHHVVIAFPQRDVHLHMTQPDQPNPLLHQEPRPEPPPPGSAAL